MKHYKLCSALLTCAMLSSMTALSVSADEAAPSETDETVLYGDVNVDANINLADAIILNKAVSGAVTLSEAASKNADCNGDGSMTLDDSISLLRFLTHLTDSLPDTGSTSQQNPLQVESKITAIGYTDALLRLAHSENSSAVITSCDELEAYLSPITSQQNMESLLAEYNDAYFEKYVLLVNAIYQGSGGDIMYAIDSVSFVDDTIQVVYSDLYEDRSYITIVNGLLGQVSVPKSQYHGETVNWIYDNGEQSEITWSIEGLTWVWTGFEDTIGKEYVINSQAELEDYFDTIYPEDDTAGIAEECEQEKNAWLAQFDDSYFKDNILLMKPTNRSSMCIDEVSYDGDTLNINTYDSRYNQTELLDAGISRYLELVTVPRTQYHARTINWNEAEITWSVNALHAYPDAYQTNIDEFVENEYIFTSQTEFSEYIYSLWPLDDAVTPYTEALQNCLDTYDEAYFSKNVLLLKPFLSWRSFDIQSVEYTGDKLYIRHGCNSYEVNDGIDLPYFGLVSVPKCLWHAEEVAWSDNKIQTAVDWIPDSNALMTKLEQDDIMEYVIQSTSELTAYFDSIYEEEYDGTSNNLYEETRDSYLNTYDDAFFAENVLLLKTIFSPYKYIIKDTYFVPSYETELYIDYTYNPYIGGCIMNPCLLQVAVPRTIYEADTVKWIQTAYGEGDEFSWTVKEMTNGCGTDFVESTEKDYIFHSTEELAEYFDTMDLDTVHDIAYEPMKNELLTEYDDSYFDNNILLMKPVFWYSAYTVENISYDGDTLNIDCTYEPHDENAVCLEMPSLTLVTVPKTLWHPESMWSSGTTVSWNCKEAEVQQPEEISWSVEEILYSGDFYSTTENEYLFTSSKELGAYFDTIYENCYTNSPNDPCAAIRSSYLEKYNDEYFEKNTLLMKPIEQNSGCGVLHTIDSVVIQNGVVKIDYTDNSFGHTEDVMTDMLALVTVPKSLWSGNASKVEWNYHSNYEITWSVDTLDVYGSNFDDTTGEEYIITSTKELEAYFDTIYLYDYTDCVYDVCTAIKNSYLEQYNDDYFAQNVLLMKPFATENSSSMLYSIEDVYYNNNALMINYTRIYSLIDSATLNPKPAASLGLVTVPKLLYHADVIEWVDTEVVYEPIGD